MSKLPNDILRAARIAKGFKSAKAAADAFGWDETTYRAHEGHRGTKGLPKEPAAKYARAFGIPVDQLLGIKGNIAGTTSEIIVIGEAAYGVWRQNALDAELKRNISSLDVPPSVEGKMRYAIKIADDSVNKSIPYGHFAIFTHSDGKGLKDNSLVVVERTRGDLVEMTVRRFVAGGQSGRLVCHSTSKLYQDALPLAGGKDDVRIVGVVVGTYSEHPDGMIVTG